MTDTQTRAELAAAKLTARELDALRRQLRAEVRAELAARPARRPARYRETPEVAAAARRMVGALADRASRDVDALPLLAELSREVDAQLASAVRRARQGEGLQGGGWSWTDVGRVLGMTRQAAQQRFGRAA